MYSKKILENFLEKSSDLEKVIVIYGPTASGKTSLSIDIARYINTEIISTDSRQIFKGLDIGTGKITENEKSGINHHMLDIVTPDSEYSVGEYKKLAEQSIKNIHSKGKIPILCGGTGLYIDSLIYNFNIPKVAKDDKLREDLESDAHKYGNNYVYEKLKNIDPNYASELHPNNIRYIIRAIEVKTLTGKSKMDFREKKVPKYDLLFITPYDMDRKKLYNNIDIRVESMFRNGFVEEVQNLLERYKPSDFGMKTIGYKEIIEYLQGNYTLDDCIELVKKNNRNYAKKQLTRFKKYKDKTD